jgi:broad specificity phosphatase PhoE
VGATYANLLVHASPGNEISADAVVAIVRSWVGQDPATKEVEHGIADRAVFVATHPATRWIGVFDQAADNTGDDDLLVGLGEALSRGLGTVVVATAVFDSDLARAWLIDGEVVDRMARPIEVLDEMTDGEIGGWDGDPDRWTAAIPGFDASALRAAWETDDVFAESRLEAAGALLGIPSGWTRAGYSYLEDQVDPGVLTLLRFRTVSEEPVVTAPRFIAAGWSPGYDRGNPPTDTVAGRLVAEVGDRFDPLINVLAEGNAADAVLVVLHGPALIRGLAALDQIQIVTVASIVNQSGLGPITVDLSDGRAGDEPVRFAVVELAPTVQALQAFLPWTHSIQILGSAAKAGSGALEITVGPRDAFVEGQCTTTVEIEIRARSGPQIQQLYIAQTE